MRRAAAVVLGTAFGLVACEGVREPMPRAASGGQPLVRGAHREMKVDLARAQLRGELGRSYERPANLKESACPDGEIAAVAKTPEERVLSLTVREGRWEPKSLVPLKVTQPVTQPDFAALETKLAGIGDGDDADVLLDSAVREMEQQRRRRYVGVLHVIDWAQPKRIHKLNKRKPEWVAGRVQAMLVIHDAASATPLCQTRVFVQNDVSEAPLAARLMSDTRDDLTAKLGQLLRAEVEPAVARITKVLTMPEDGRLAVR